MQDGQREVIGPMILADSHIADFGIAPDGALCQPSATPLAWRLCLLVCPGVLLAGTRKYCEIPPYRRVASRPARKSGAQGLRNDCDLQCGRLLRSASNP